MVRRVVFPTLCNVPYEFCFARDTANSTLMPLVGFSSNVLFVRKLTSRSKPRFVRSIMYFLSFEM